MLAGERQDFRLLGFQRAGPHVVRLGQHALVGHGGAVHQVHHRDVGGLDLDPRVQQQQHPAQRGPAAQVFEHQALPVLLHRLGRLRVAVARHVHQRQPAAEVEEVELPGAPRRVGGARQGVMADQGVDER